MPPAKRKRPAKMADLSDREDEEGYDEVQFLEEEDSPAWDIIYPKSPATNSSKRIKKMWEEATEHTSPFHGKNQSKEALNLRYDIKPHLSWEDMRNYSKFVIEKEDYKKLDYVYVSPHGLQVSSKPDEKKYWIARILEIKAADVQHVFALVVWMYWPDQLLNAHVGKETAKSGQRSYHGKHELIASNHLDVMDVTTLAGHAPVEQWLEEDDNDVQDGLYWRQTYDIKTGNLSDLGEHCSCGKYYNPDHVMLACSNKECRIWMHQECIINAALTKAHDQLMNPGEEEEKKTKTKKKKTGRAKRVSRDKLAHELSYKLDHSIGKHFAAETVDDGNQIEVTNLLSGEVCTEPTRCLKCEVRLE